MHCLPRCPQHPSSDLEESPGLLGFAFHVFLAEADRCALSWPLRPQPLQWPPQAEGREEPLLRLGLEGWTLRSLMPHFGLDGECVSRGQIPPRWNWVRLGGACSHTRGCDSHRGITHTQTCSDRSAPGGTQAPATSPRFPACVPCLNVQLAAIKQLPAGRAGSPCLPGTLP